MAVVTRTTNGYPGLTPTAGMGFQIASPHEAEANVKASFFSIAIANGDSIGSIYKLGRMISSALILPQSNAYTTAIAGLTSVSIGFDNLTGTQLATALANAVDMHLGGAFPLMSNVLVNNYGLRVWQLLGLTSDPGAMIDVIAKLGAATTASGTLAGHILWSLPGV